MIWLLSCNLIIIQPWERILTKTLRICKGRVTSLRNWRTKSRLRSRRRCLSLLNTSLRLSCGISMSVLRTHVSRILSQSYENQSSQSCFKLEQHFRRKNSQKLKTLSNWIKKYEIFSGKQLINFFKSWRRKRKHKLKLLFLKRLLISLSRLR